MPQLYSTGFFNIQFPQKGNNGKNTTYFNNLVLNTLDKSTIIYGANQTGKTTAIQLILSLELYRPYLGHNRNLTYYFMQRQNKFPGMVFQDFTTDENPNKHALVLGWYQLKPKPQKMSTSSLMDNLKHNYTSSGQYTDRTALDQYRVIITYDAKELAKDHIPPVSLHNYDLLEKLHLVNNIDGNRIPCAIYTPQDKSNIKQTILQYGNSIPGFQYESNVLYCNALEDSKPGRFAQFKNKLKQIHISLKILNLIDKIDQNEGGIDRYFMAPGKDDLMDRTQLIKNRLKPLIFDSHPEIKNNYRDTIDNLAQDLNLHYQDQKTFDQKHDIDNMLKATQALDANKYKDGIKQYNNQSLKLIKGYITYQQTHKHIIQEIQANQDQLITLKLKNTGLNLKQHQLKLKSLQNQKANIQQQIDDINHTIENLKSQKLDKQNEYYQSKLYNKYLELQTDKQKITDDQNKLNNNTNTNKERKRLEKLGQKLLNYYHNQLHDLKQQENNFQKQIKELKAQKKSTNQNLNQYQTDKTTTKADITNMNKIIKNLKNSINQETQSIQQDLLQYKHPTNATNPDILQNCYQKLISQSRQSKSQYQAKIDNTQEQIDQNNQDESDNQARLQNLAGQKQNKASELKEKQTTYQKEKNTQTKYHIQKFSKDRFQDELTNLRDNLEHQEDQLDIQIAKQDGLVKQLKAKQLTEIPASIQNLAINYQSGFNYLYNLQNTAKQQKLLKQLPILPYCILTNTQGMEIIKQEDKQNFQGNLITIINQDHIDNLRQSDIITNNPNIITLSSLNPKLLNDYDGYYNQKKDKLKQLNNQKTKLANRLKKINNQLSYYTQLKQFIYQDDINRTQNALDQINQDIDKLNQNNKAIQSKNKELNKNQVKYHDEINDFNNLIKHCQNKQTQDLVQLKNDIQSLKTDKNKEQTLEQSHKQAEQKYNQTQQKLDKINEDLTTAQGKLDKNQSTQQTIQNHITTITKNKIQSNTHVFFSKIKTYAQAHTLFERFQNLAQEVQSTQGAIETRLQNEQQWQQEHEKQYNSILKEWQSITPTNQVTERDWNQYNPEQHASQDVLKKQINYFEQQINKQDKTLKPINHNLVVAQTHVKDQQDTINKYQAKHQNDLNTIQNNQNITNYLSQYQTLDNVQETIDNINSQITATNQALAHNQNIKIWLEQAWAANRGHKTLTTIKQNNPTVNVDQLVDNTLNLDDKTTIKTELRKRLDDYHKTKQLLLNQLNHAINDWTDYNNNKLNNGLGKYHELFISIIKSAIKDRDNIKQLVTNIKPQVIIAQSKDIEVINTQQDLIAKQLQNYWTSIQSHAQILVDQTKNFHKQLNNIENASRTTYPGIDGTIKLIKISQPASDIPNNDKQTQIFEQKIIKRIDTIYQQTRDHYQNNPDKLQKQPVPIFKNALKQNLDITKAYEVLYQNISHIKIKLINIEGLPQQKDYILWDELNSDDSGGAKLRDALITLLTMIYYSGNSNASISKQNKHSHFIIVDNLFASANDAELLQSALTFAEKTKTQIITLTDHQKADLVDKVNNSIDMQSQNSQVLLQYGMESHIINNDPNNFLVTTTYQETHDNNDDNSQNVLA